MLDDATLGFAGRILLAGLLGGLIGIEREVDGHPAGFRTHISVALGAALFGVISTDGFDRFVDTRASTNVQVDVTRVASQVVVGIGFLGAGTIVKHGGAVRGLTTAASLWVVAAVGLAVGITAYGAAVVTTIAMLLALVGLRWPRRWLRSYLSSRRRTLTIRVGERTQVSELLAAVEDLDGITVHDVSIRAVEGGTIVDVVVKPEPGANFEHAVGELADLELVAELEIG